MTAATPFPAPLRPKQSARCGLGLRARRIGGPRKAGLRVNPAPFPITAWGCEPSVPVPPNIISGIPSSWDRIRARCRPPLTGTAPDAAMPYLGAFSGSRRGPPSSLSAWARARVLSLGRPHFEVTLYSSWSLAFPALTAFPRGAEWASSATPFYR